MTVRVLAVLWALRIDGPSSIAGMAERTGRDRETVYRTVYALRRRGLVDRIGMAAYDLTEAGRQVLARETKHETLF